jgi:nicotinamide-nucleotide amidase
MRKPARPARRSRPGAGTSLPVAVVTTGTELTTGRTVDTNAARLARFLAPVGGRVVFHVTVGDDRASIADALRLAAARARLVIVSGGLGPTRDDLTRDVIAACARQPLLLHAPSLARIARRLAARLGPGVPVPENNRRQALIPRGAEVLPNPAGTAAGFALRLGRAWCVALPGVPREMDVMMTEIVLPWLRRRGLARRPAVQKSLLLFGIPESVADDAIDRVGVPLDGLEIALTVDEGAVKIVLATPGGAAPRGARGRGMVRRIRTLHRALCRRFGDAVVSTGGLPLAESVARALRRRRRTVALAESCTGGLVTRKLAAVPGISASLLEAVVAYGNRAKVRRLGVPAALIRRHGAVSAEVAEAMARGIVRTSGADVGIAVTGIAGPGGGTPEKPVGLVWFGACAAGRVRTESRRFRGDRREVQERAAMTALDLLRRAIP